MKKIIVISILLSISYYIKSQTCIGCWTPNYDTTNVFKYSITYSELTNDSIIFDVKYEYKNIIGHHSISFDLPFYYGYQDLDFYIVDSLAKLIKHNKLIYNSTISIGAKSTSSYTHQFIFGSGTNETGSKLMIQPYSKEHNCGKNILINKNERGDF